MSNLDHKGSSVLPVVKDTARIARSGTQRWLVTTQLAPEDAWPVVKEFWQDMGFLLKVEAPDIGIVETDWAENRAKIPQDLIRGLLSTFLDSIYSSAERDKFAHDLKEVSQVIPRFILAIVAWMKCLLIEVRIVQRGNLALLIPI